MNWDIIKGKWAQFAGDIKTQWGELTDDEITQANGEREKFAGLLQEKYGWAKDEAERKVDEYFSDKS